MYVQVLDACGNETWYDVPSTSTLVEGDQFNEGTIAGAIKLSAPPNISGYIRCRQTSTTTTQSTTTGNTTSSNTTATTATTTPTVLCQRGPSISGFQLKSNKQILIYYDAQGVNQLEWTLYRIVNSVRQFRQGGQVNNLTTNNFYINFADDLPASDYDIVINCPYCRTNLQGTATDTQRFTVTNNTTVSTAAPVGIVDLYSFETDINATTTTSANTVKPLCVRGPSIYGLTLLSATRMEIGYDAQGVNNMDWTLRENNVVIDYGNTGVLTTNKFVVLLTRVTMQDGHGYEFEINSVTCRTNSTGSDSNIRQFVFGTGLTQTTSQTTAPAQLAFVIVSYDYLTGRLAYKATGGNGSSVNINIPNLQNATILADQVVNQQLTGEKWLGYRFVGTLRQGLVEVAVDFTTSQTLGGTQTTTTPATTGTTTTSATTFGTTGALDGIPLNSFVTYSNIFETRPMNLIVEWNNGRARIRDTATNVPTYHWWYFIDGQNGKSALNTSFGYQPGDKIVIYKSDMPSPGAWVTQTFNTDRASAQLTIGLPNSSLIVEGDTVLNN